MSEIGESSRVLVKDVMSNPVITIMEDSSAVEAARLMEKHKIGSVIVTSKRGEPIGMITETDLVTRVVAKNIKATELPAKEAMTAPIFTVDPGESLTDAARRMSELDIERLGVIKKGRLVGIISSKDILAITPELIEILQENSKIQEPTLEEVMEVPQMAGFCDCCGTWSDSLEEVEDSFLCEECKDER